jgi:hypothetical protein
MLGRTAALPGPKGAPPLLSNEKKKLENLENPKKSLLKVEIKDLQKQREKSF